MHCAGAVTGLLFVITWCLGAATVARADPITHLGIEFSDELGGFRLLSVSGTGTIDDPITVIEEVTEPQRHVILTIRGFSRAFGNRVGTQHLTGFAMRKIVHNRSERIWNNYQMELREVTSRRSPYSDGLSFGQDSTLGEAYPASGFPHIQRYDEPEDSLGFSGAEVPPGGAADFQFIVSDMSPSWQFFLVQIPMQPLSNLAPGVPGAINWAGE
jgi:hypothetical protein